MKIYLRALYTLWLSFSLYQSSAQQPLNAGFEMKGRMHNGLPFGWQVYSFAEGATVSMDSLTKYEGSYSLAIKREKKNEEAFQLGFWMETFAIKNNELKTSVRLKSKEFKGNIDLFLTSWSLDGKQAADTLSISQTGDWEQYELSIPLDPEAYGAYLIFNIEGQGQVWFDDLQFFAGEQKVIELAVAPLFNKEEQAWLENRSKIIRTVEPHQTSDDSFHDLKPFKAIVGDAKLVALGEATHGTSEFFNLKHRLLQYCVEELGFTVFAIEANQLPVETINKYVLYGEGEAKKVMRSMFAVWNTSEMLDLIQWVRTYNLNHKDKPVHFVGFDMQDPRMPIDSLLTFIRIYEPGLAQKAEAYLIDIQQNWKSAHSQPDSVKMAWQEHVKELYEIIQAETGPVRANRTIPVSKMNRGIQNIRVILQAITSLNSPTITYRDSAMADNIDWLLHTRFPNEKIVIWAHDSHISRSDDPEDANDYFEGASMGAYLSKRHGDNYKAFGLATYEGTYTATTSWTDHTMISHQLWQSPRESFDYQLHTIAKKKNTNVILVDLSSQNLPEWLFVPRPVRFIGYAPADYDYGQQVSLPYQFDGLFFIDRSNASVKTY